MRLSIIVPVYNVEKYLRRCVDSILGQTFRDFEVLLVDDGSKDGCGAICDGYAAADSRVRVLHQRNGGYSSAMNHGLTEARGEWLGIVEPDDWIEPDMYARLLEQATDDVEVVKTNFVKFHAETGEQRNTIWTRIDRYGLMSGHPSIWTCIYRRELIERNHIRFTAVPGAAWTDNLFLYQTLVLAREVRYVEHIAYHYLVKSWRNLDQCGNFRYPLDRMLEIVQWLSGAGIRDPKVWESVGTRTVLYARTSYDKAKVRELKEYRRKVREIARAMPEWVAVDRQLGHILRNPLITMWYDKHIRGGVVTGPVRKVYRWLRGTGEFARG